MVGSNTATQEHHPENTETSKIQEILHDIKVDGGKKSLWAMTVETLGMSEGKNKRHDVYVKNKQEGINVLKELVEISQKVDEKYKMDLTPFQDFDASMDTLLRSFVHWSYADNKYNISKAFRRLESYVKWMDDNRRIIGQKLTNEERKDAHRIWGPMKLTKSGSTLVWWFDVTTIDIKAVKRFDHDITIKYFVWICHYMLFQDFEDVILMENLEGLNMIETFTMVPPDIGAKMDRFTIGVLPIRLKNVYLIHNPRWMAIILALMKPFLSKKMRRRMISLNKKENLEDFFSKTVGADAVPTGFCGVEGRVESDEFAKNLSLLLASPF